MNRGQYLSTIPPLIYEKTSLFSPYTRILNLNLLLHMMPDGITAMPGISDA